MRILTAILLTLLFFADPLAGQSPTASSLLSSAIYEEEISGNLEKAIGLYQEIIKKYPDDRPVAAKALYHLGLVTEKLGKQKAEDYYRRLIDGYPEQTELVGLARKNLQRLGDLSADGAQVRDPLKAQENLFNLGYRQYKEGKYPASLETFRTLQREYPKGSLTPITELLISQINQILKNSKPEKTTLALDENTRLDTSTGIKYTRITSWSGTRDWIQSATWIHGISKEKRFLLANNRIFPFDNQAPFEIFKNPENDQVFSRLSPNGDQVAFIKDTAIVLVRISQDNSGVTETLRIPVLSEDSVWGDPAWSPDGTRLILSTSDTSGAPGSSLWMVTLVDRTFKKLRFDGKVIRFADPFFSKSGSNFFFREVLSGSNISNTYVNLSSRDNGGKVYLLGPGPENGRFIPSPDNTWILYKSAFNKTTIFHFPDQQQFDVQTPGEVGEFISYADRDSVFYFFCSSYEDRWLSKIISVSGGPAFEFDEKLGQYPEGWMADGNSFVIRTAENPGLGLERKIGFNVVNKWNQTFRPIEGLSGYNFVAFSTDFKGAMVANRVPGKMPALYYISFSLPEFKIIGEPVKLIGNYAFASPYSWSPDGKSLVFQILGDLWIYPVNGDAPTQLTKTEESENYPDWSPAGDLISVWINKSHQLRLINLPNGEVVMIQDSVEMWAWAPDGKNLAIASHTGSLVTYNVRSGESRYITNWKGGCNCSGISVMSWSPDGKWIGFNGYNETNAVYSRMYLVNAESGLITELDTDDTRNKENFIWSPDSKWILYNTYGLKKVRFESTLWEADFSGFMKKLPIGPEKGLSAEIDFSVNRVPAGGVPPDGTFLDERDGHEYKYKNIGGQTWMAENLAYLPEVSPDSISSTEIKHYYVYGNKSTSVEEAKRNSNWKIYGVLYNWQAAVDEGPGGKSGDRVKRGICPEGWHLPDDYEWNALTGFLGWQPTNQDSTGRRSVNVSAKLRAINFWEDDNLYIGENGFDARPGGLIDPKFHQSAIIGKSAYYWTSSLSGGRRIGRIINPLWIYRTATLTDDYGLSIRCIRDH